MLCVYGIIVAIYLFTFRQLLDDRSYSPLVIMQNLFTPFEYIIFTTIFYLSAGKKKRKVLLSLSIAYIVFLIFLFIANPVKLSSLSLVLDTIPVGIETILIFIYIFSFLYEHSKIENAESIYNSSLFWISVGLLFYLGGSFFFNILVTQMSLAEFDNYWHYTYIAEVLKNILFLIALLKISTVKKKGLLPQVRMTYLDIDMN